MKSSFLPFVATTAACGLLTVSALAQGTAPAAPGTVPPAPGTAPAAPGTAPAATPAPKPLGVSEKNFIKNAAKSINYQLELTKVAKTGVTDEKLAKVRDTVLRDLGKAWEGVKKVAAAGGETVATELTGGDKMDVERLGKLKDDKFAKQWLEDLTKEAKKLDRDFETASKTLQDPEIKTFAANYGPTVRSVFTSAESAEKGLKAKK